MDIFEVVGQKATPTMHALLTEPFKSIWERDGNPNKANAVLDFTYIELMCSYKKTNVFIGYGEDVRASKVIAAMNDAGDYLPDDLVLQGMSAYRKMQEEASPALRLIKSCEKGLNELQTFLETVDLTDRTNSGAAVYKPVDIPNAIKQISDAYKALQGMKEKAQQELSDSTKTRGQREINYFER